MKFRNTPKSYRHSQTNYRNMPQYTNYRRQVFIEFREPATACMPIADRKYTMTHSDETGDLFVVIATEYAEDKVSDFRDEVRLEWTVLKDTPILYGSVLIDGEGIDSTTAEKRNDIFKREMPLALQAIYNADYQFFAAYPELRNTPVLIQFVSTIPNYSKLYCFGSIGEYSQIEPRYTN